MGLKLLVLLTVSGIFGMTIASLYFTRPLTLPGYEWLIAMGAIGGAVVTIAGIRGIIFEIRMKKLLNQK